MGSRHERANSFASISETIGLFGGVGVISSMAEIRLEGGEAVGWKTGRRHGRCAIVQGAATEWGGHAS